MCRRKTDTRKLLNGEVLLILSYRRSDVRFWFSTSRILLALTMLNIFDFNADTKVQGSVRRGVSTEFRIAIIIILLSIDY